MRREDEWTLLCPTWKGALNLAYFCLMKERSMPLNYKYVCSEDGFYLMESFIACVN